MFVSKKYQVHISDESEVHVISTYNFADEYKVFKLL